MRNTISEYLIAMRQVGRSKATIKQYGWHLRKMAVWLDRRDVDRVEDVSRSLLRRWGAGLRDEWSPATVKQAICAARAFFTWCLEEGIADSDPGQALKVPHVPDRIHRTLTADEVQTLLDGCDESLYGQRNRALVSLLADSGLRAAEICRLRIADLDLEMGLLRVIGKGGDEDWGFFGRVTARRIRQWLRVRPNVEGVETLFVSVGGNTPGHPLTTSGLRNALRRLGRKVGIRGVCPHAFRRAFACITTEAGTPSRVLQEMGRWNDIRMIRKYTRALKVAELAGQYSAVDFMETE